MGSRDLAGPSARIALRDQLGGGKTAAPAMARPVTAAPSSSMTAMEVGSSPRLKNCMKVRPAACAPCMTARVATSRE